MSDCRFGVSPVNCPDSDPELFSVSVEVIPASRMAPRSTTGRVEFVGLRNRRYSRNNHYLHYNYVQTS